MGGQFSPAKGGQFAPAKGGQFNPALGGQFNRLLQYIKAISILNNANAILESGKSK